MADLAAPLAEALMDRDVPALTSYPQALRRVGGELAHRFELLSRMPITHPDSDPSDAGVLTFTAGLLLDLAKVRAAALAGIKSGDASAARRADRIPTRDLPADLRRNGSTRGPLAP